MYGKLEEPDGLEGLVKLRQGGPRPADQRLAAEKAGNWAEAATLYEQALQHGGDGGVAVGGRGVVARASVEGEVGRGPRSRTFFRPLPCSSTRVRVYENALR